MEAGTVKKTSLKYLISGGLLALLLAVGSPFAGHAQEVGLTVPLAGKLDLGKFLANTRASLVIDQHIQKLAGAHIPLASVHDASGLELVNFNGGLVYETDSLVGGPMVSFSARVDNLLRKWTAHPWAKKHLTTIALPALEVGPAAGYVHRQGWVYGVFLALPFGTGG